MRLQPRATSDLSACLPTPCSFGWTEWTDEALFWRRPRLHAWYELMQYERGAQEVKEAVSSRLAEIVVDWSQLELEVPTARLRTFPKHTL